MAAADDKIKEVLARYDEPFTQGQGGNVWRVQGVAVISHRCLERVAAKAKISFDQPTVLRCERDEAVILVTGMIPTGAKIEDEQPDAPDWVHGPTYRTEWSIGEALVNVNYRVSGKQAAYVYAMAEKRAKDRVILKLVELHGLAYSEEEADEFKGCNQSRQDDRQDDADNDDSSSKRLLREMSAQLWKVRGVEGVKAVTDDLQFRQQFRALEEDDRARLGALIQERRAA